MKVKAEIAPNGSMSRLWLDDKEITQNVREFHIAARAGEPSSLVIALVPKEIIIAEGDIESIQYSAPDGQVLTEVVHASHLWHCVCGAWNHVFKAECRVCGRPSGEAQ